MSERIEQALLTFLRRPGERIFEVPQSQTFALEIHPHGIFFGFAGARV